MTPEPTFAFCAALVDGLVQQGVNHAAVSPGSRNTPLLLALQGHPGIETSVHHDERSAAFFALGMAKATGRPPVLSCTSGTAATEYLPAVTEARMARYPLIVLTADRPPELQDRGSPQTINQTELYGIAAKWFHDTGVPDATAASAGSEIARRVAAVALEPPAGPVHLNVPLREPLVPPRRLHPPPGASDPGRPEPPAPQATAAEIEQLAELIDGRAVAIVAGAVPRPGAGSAVARFAEVARGIVIADPQAEIRFGGSDHPALISTADLLVAGGRAPSPPEVVIHVGAIPTSKPVHGWLQDLGVELVHVDEGPWHDPLRIATRIVAADPADTLERVAGLVAPGPPEFVSAWRRADDAAGAALATGFNEISEPAIGWTVADTVPSGSLVMAGSSMPIRLIDSYGVRRTRPARFIANRGANGIDGTIATALGVAAARLGPTYAVLGDLTALVDLGSLLTASRLEIPITIVVINNDGGGIFEYLPHADPERIAPGVFSEMIVAPHGRRLAPLARAYGVEAVEVTDLATLGALLAEVPRRPRLLEIRTDRATGPAARSAAIEMVAGAVAAA